MIFAKKDVIIFYSKGWTYMGKIISYVNQKGGVGKTTTCVNLSAFLAVKGKKVLLIDMDPQGNASSGVGVEKSPNLKTIYSAIDGECSLHDTIKKTSIKGLDVIPSTVDLAGAEIELVQINHRETVLRQLLNQIKFEYDYIMIDCPPSLALLSINALTASDSIIIPIQCEFYALEGLSQLMNTVKLVKKHLNPKIEIEGVVLTMRDSRSNLVQEVSDEIRTYFGKKVFDTAIPRNVRLAEAPSHGLPIYAYDPKCAGAIAYESLANEFLKRQKSDKGE